MSLEVVHIFRTTLIWSQGRPLADWTDCFQSGPALRLQTYTFNRKCLCSAGAGPTVYF